MTAVETPTAVDEAEAQLERLQERAFDLMQKALAPASVTIARGAMNDAGIARSRRNLSEALDKFSNEQITVRAKQEAERTAKDAYEDALAMAEWELDNRFVTEGNKTFLLIAGESEADEPDRKAMTADERAKWKTLEARKDTAVKSAYSALRKAESETATARDALALADKRISACRADLEAATAVVGVYASAITIRSES